MTAKVFIDGEAGTTGLEIRERLRARDGIDVIRIDPDRRKDPAARAAIMADADVVILCLPDEAARESVRLADSLGSRSPRLLDASTAHRVAPGWVYGFAELTPGQPDAIRNASKVTNPGCYPTGAIALIRPLLDAGLIPADFALSVNAVSGYSGGGRAMIDAFEGSTTPNFELYGLALEHKHLAEMQHYGGLSRRPIFVPSVGRFRQGMLVSIPLHLDALPAKPSCAAIEEALAGRYAGSRFVTVVRAGDAALASGKLDPEGLNGTDRMELRVFGNEARRQAVLVARLDNLGKGASGAAVQNLALMLGG